MLAACVVVLVYGGYLTTSIPIDVFPDLDRPRVVILTECPGLSPEEVETLITQPIETALLGASGVEAVRSQSSQGMNVIYVEFDWRTEIRYARQVVMERLATVPMPPGIRPQMTPPASIMGQILHVVGAGQCLAAVMLHVPVAGLARLQAGRESVQACLFS